MDPFHIRLDPDQNLTAPLTCIVRPSAAAITLPNAGESTLKLPPAGLVQRTKLKGLVASTLRSSVRRSLILKALPTVSASCFPQNPRTQLKVGARVPKLNPVDGVKAATFKNVFLAGSKSRGLVVRYGDTPPTALGR